MTVKQLASIAKRTRDAQKGYFRHRGNLAECKQLELELDRAIKVALDAEPETLFGKVEPPNAVLNGK